MLIRKCTHAFVSTSPCPCIFHDFMPIFSPIKIIHISSDVYPILFHRVHTSSHTISIIEDVPHSKTVSQMAMRDCEKLNAKYGESPDDFLQCPHSAAKTKLTLFHLMQEKRRVSATDTRTYYSEVNWLMTPSPPSFQSHQQYAKYPLTPINTVHERKEYNFLYYFFMCVDLGKDLLPSTFLPSIYERFVYLLCRCATFSKRSIFPVHSKWYLHLPASPFTNASFHNSKSLLRKRTHEKVLFSFASQALFLRKGILRSIFQGRHRSCSLSTLSLLVSSRLAVLTFVAKRSQKREAKCTSEACVKRDFRWQPNSY